MQRLSKLPHLVSSKDGQRGARADACGSRSICARSRSADVRVRQAISLALDREKIVDVIWYGQGKPARGPDRQRQSDSTSTRR